MSVVLITGAATGIGNLTARELAKDGHTVYASMLDPDGRFSDQARDLEAFAAGTSGELRVIPLDVLSQDSADSAVRSVLGAEGQLDILIQNAGHLHVGYVEAFTAEEIAELIDVNALGVHRTNRAVLPHMRGRREGTLVYVSSTIPITTPPFLGPYSAAKAAMDMLALSTALEVGQLGIETTIVMPGPFTAGTDHFPNADHATDPDIDADYSVLDPLLARNLEATNNLYPPGVDPQPVAVAEEISRVLKLPFGEKPLRTVVDFTDSGVENANEVVTAARSNFIRRMGFEQVLEWKRPTRSGR